MGPGGWTGKTVYTEGPNAGAGRKGRGQWAQYINRCGAGGWEAQGGNIWEYSHPKRSKGILPPEKMKNESQILQNGAWWVEGKNRVPLKAETQEQAGTEGASGPSI